MRSKYDDFWAGLLPLVRAQVQLAAIGSPAAVAVPGLTRLGIRQSWYGTAEIRAQKMTFSSGAHATSLGKMVAASGVCQQWPQHAFRFTVAADGDVLTIAVADQHRRQARPAPKPGGQARTVQRQEKRQLAPRADRAGRGRPPGTARGRGSDAEEFYRILDELAARLGGPRRLHDCSAGPDARRRASTSSTKTARTALTAAPGWCALAPTP